VRTCPVAAENIENSFLLKEMPFLSFEGTVVAVAAYFNFLKDFLY